MDGTISSSLGIRGSIFSYTHLYVTVERFILVELMYSLQVRLLASLEPGTNIGRVCRTMMWAVFSNEIMSRYSCTGQKGKSSFKGTTIFKVMTSKYFPLNL